MEAEYVPSLLDKHFICILTSFNCTATTPPRLLFMIQRASIHCCHTYQQSRSVLGIPVTSFWLGWGRGNTNILNHFSQNDISFWSLPKCLPLVLHWLKPGPRGKDCFLFSYCLFLCLFTQRLEVILLWGTPPAQAHQKTAKMPHS